MLRQIVTTDRSHLIQSNPKSEFISDGTNPRDFFNALPIKNANLNVVYVTTILFSVGNVLGNVSGTYRKKIGAHIVLMQNYVAMIHVKYVLIRVLQYLKKLVVGLQITKRDLEMFL